MESIEKMAFISKHQISYLGEGLTKFINHINELAPQLLTGFGDDDNKTRYHLRTVLGITLGL